MKRSITARIVLALSVVIVTALGAAGYYFSGLVVTPRVWDFDESYRCEIREKRFSEGYYRSLPREEFTITSPHGYGLNAVWVPVKDSKKTVIFVHGHTFTLMGGYKYLEIFRKRGYNALLFDSRFQGKSGGRNITFGKYEKDDLETCVKWVRERAGWNSTIGVHGESMGSAVCLLHAAAFPGCNFYILDGAMASLEGVLAYRLRKDFGLPAFPLLHAASLAARLRGAMFFSEIAPIDAISRVRAPLFFIHGGEDRDIPVENARRLHAAAPGLKRLWICPGAAHSKSVLTDPAGYEREVAAFLDGAVSGRK